MSTERGGPHIPKKPAAKARLLTPVQRDVLQALADGALMTLDRTNSSWIGDKSVAFQTRSILAQRRLITRQDPSRNADAPGNGFIISDNGRAALAASPAPKRKSAVAAEKSAELPRQPSEAQLDYAGDLGIQVPPGATMRELSDLISAHAENDVSPTDEQLAWAAYYQVEHTRYVGRRALLANLQATLSRPPREPDLVRWFAFCVASWLEPAFCPVLTGPGDPRLRRVCAALLADDVALKSVRRYATSYSLWTPAAGSTDGVPRVSTDTAGYRLANALFRVTRAV